MDSERERREEELEREPAPSQTVGAAYDSLAEPTRVHRAGEPRVEHVSEDAVRGAARRGTREALEEKELEESGGGG